MYYVFLAQGFEQLEALAPVDIMRRAEIEVYTVGVGGKVVTSSHNTPVVADVMDSEICPDRDCEGIILPGGMPGTLNLEKSPVVQQFIDYCAENGYNTIDFSDDGMLEKANIDITKDFCNDGHLNSRGGIKGTQYICDYLIENGYYTPDHRGEETYSDWDEATEKYFKYYEKGWKEKESDK